MHGFQEEKLVCASAARARQATELAAQKVEEDNANRVTQFVAVRVRGHIIGHARNNM